MIEHHGSSSHKVTAAHLARKAVVYLRQSSPKQVRENLESQRLQYALADHARALGFGSNSRGMVHKLSEASSLTTKELTMPGNLSGGSTVEGRRSWRSTPRCHGEAPSPVRPAPDL